MIFLINLYKVVIAMVPYQPVLTFWFEECTPKQWFQKDSAFDKEIKDRFGELCISASRAELASWRESIEGRLGKLLF